MSDWYDVTGVPATRAALVSATIRAEFALIETAMAKLPTLTGAGDELLKVNAGGTALETVASLGVAQGGTGAATLTDGGILLGSGTGAITAMAALADGEMIVGDGTTDPVAESGATLRTSIGVGTGDSPSFAGLSLTAPLSVANGGTGAATLTNGGVLLGSGTGAITAMGVLADGQMIVGDGTTDPVAESGATLRTSIGVGTGDAVTLGSLALTTDLAVAHGGTGASTHTAGGILYGNGTSAIANTGVLAVGTILVGDGTGAPTLLAVGTDTYVLTADSGEASGVSWSAIGGGSGVGTLTTIKRNNVQVGGADIAILDFSSQFTVSESPNTEIQVAINAASESVAGVIEVATDTEVNTGSVGTLAIRPSSLAQWAGSSNIVTLGTVTTGVWTGTAIAVTRGGTGGTSAAAGRTNLGVGTGDTPTFGGVTLTSPLAVTSGGTGATSASGARSALGLGSLAILNTISNSNWSGTDLSVLNGGTGSSTAAGARTNLGLGSLATLSTINGGNWSGTDLSVLNGGTGSSTAAGARTNLGLGSLAILNTISNSNWSGTDLSVANGGTGSSTAAAARTALDAMIDPTVSTSAPSGGSSGDFWFVREA